MNKHLLKLFEDRDIQEHIKTKLPYLFHIAELESSRGGKIKMEVGSLREKIIIALLIYTFGEENVEAEIPATEPEVDVRLSGNPISVKTFTGKYFSGVKLAWTVDAASSKAFRAAYCPVCDLLLAQIIWEDTGGFYFIPLEVQRSVLKKMGKRKYIKLPKPGTNPRGIEFAKDALSSLVNNKDTKVIKIPWERPQTDYKPYKRWVDYWKD